jgi:hypothetical protein
MEHIWMLIGISKMCFNMSELRQRMASTSGECQCSTRSIYRHLTKETFLDPLARTSDAATKEAWRYATLTHAAY